MNVSRRSTLQFATALVLAPWVGHASDAVPAQDLFSTGSPDVDHRLGGGVRVGSLLVVADDGAGDAVSRFMVRMADANGVSQVHRMTAGGSDMLSLMRLPDGRRTGCLLLNSPEPTTDKEQLDMRRDPAARDAFLSRWFRRSRDVARESGGIMAIGVHATVTRHAGWVAIPDYLVSADRGVIGRT